MWTQLVRKKALHAGVIGTPVFVGTGENDIVVSGTPYFAPSRQYVVTIDSANETFKWSNDNGATWEEEDVSIAAITQASFYELKNAEGEKEGIKFGFSGGATGHDDTDEWSFTTTGNVVSSTLVAVSAIQANSGAEELIVRGEYSKGTEDGLQLRIYSPLEYNDTVLHRPCRGIDTGDGGLIYKAEYMKLDASGNYMFRFNISGLGLWRLYQIRDGAAAVTGVFTAFGETYKII